MGSAITANAPPAASASPARRTRWPGVRFSTTSWAWVALAPNPLSGTSSDRVLITTASLPWLSGSASYFNIYGMPYKSLGMPYKSFKTLGFGLWRTRRKTNGPPVREPDEWEQLDRSKLKQGTCQTPGSSGTADHELISADLCSGSPVLVRGHIPMTGERPLGREGPDDK